MRRFDIMHPARVPQKIAMESPKFCEIKVAVCFTKNGIAKVAGYIYIFTQLYIYKFRYEYFHVCMYSMP